MPIYKVDTVIRTLTDVYLGNDKTFFTTEGKTVYNFHKPGNAPKAGDSIDGTIAPDKRGDLKFTRTQLPLGTPSTEATGATAKVFRADPDKMKQEFTLEQARNMSIQRQVAVKATVDLIVSSNRTYDQLHSTYVHIMEMLSQPNWQAFDVPDRPPIENYDILPSEDDIEDDELQTRLEEAIEVTEREPEHDYGY